jgi:hypothetical protein
MNQGTEWGLLMEKNRSQKSRASVPLRSTQLWPVVNVTFASAQLVKGIMTYLNILLKEFRFRVNNIQILMHKIEKNKKFNPSA